MRMLISGFSPAKELGTRANQKISGYNRIHVDGCKRFEYAACGRENFRNRKKNTDTCGHGLNEEHFVDQTMNFLKTLNWHSFKRALRWADTRDLVAGTCSSKKKVWSTH